MYINPFWCGVIVGIIGTISLEIAVTILLVKGCETSNDK